MPRPAFLPGLDLCRLFHTEAVAPLIAATFTDLRYAAARVGPGSDVLGFDSARSTDHDWGPRLELFCAPDDVSRYGAPLSELLARRLPKRFRGWPTHFEPPDERVRCMADTDGPVAHRVQLTDLGTWFAGQLGFDPRAGAGVLDWLATPAQRFAEVTGGAVFRDDDGELSAVRQRLHWYPVDVWRYVLACQWTRIAQEEPFVGRAGEAGDDLGGRLVTARLAREVARLCLLLARRFPPYTKWLGGAVAAVPAAAQVVAALGRAVRADAAPDRETALCAAYEAAGAWQNRLGLAAAVAAMRRAFHDRPYAVIDAQRFADALRERITDPVVAALPPVGAVDQFVDSTDLLVAPALCRAVALAALQPTNGTG